MSFLPKWIGRHDYESLHLGIGLNYDFPRPASIICNYNPSPFNNIRPITPGAFEHLAKADLRKPTINHPLEHMRAELKIPIPPIRPPTSNHMLTPFYHKKSGQNRVFLSNTGISCGRVRRPGGPARRVLRRRRDGSGRQLHAEFGGRPSHSATRTSLLLKPEKPNRIVIEDVPLLLFCQKSG